ncbi:MULTISPECIES: calcium:proton antiporter [unclassified Frondihabitans]|uniref:calcium:proton antiporter n=1 Tax=unclassified Frondihabitans TaxID=2626248 RepID=UPI000F515089|nr:MULTISPECIES: ionic transporter y4hA [unclassified Frondihabitans]RPE78058.1 Ca2+:H+ antiporter [Frondihabitans sp. PhB153]RPF08338.1 Ca2+:H+ antiporter [Frondihabitans sp. PhB161]
MAAKLRTYAPIAMPVLALIAVVATYHRYLSTGVAILVGAILIGAVLSAVHHAEVVAHRVGEPLGSIVLAVAVTVIEVGLIITLMLAGGSGTETLARDTAFAAVMITCNGIVGLSLFLGSLKHGLPRFNREGTGAALSVVATLAGAALVLPAFTTGASGGRFTGVQLAFVAVIALALWLAFVSTQTGRHRDFFLPIKPPSDARLDSTDSGDHADPPTNRATIISLVLLVVSLLSVVQLGHAVQPNIESGLAAAGIPSTFVGVVIAFIVLLPEGIAASRAALGNRLQTSLNLGYGSAIASIGLTIPAIAVASIWLDGPLVLGLGPVQLVLLALTLLVSVLTVAPGRSTRLQGIIHLIILAAFVFLAISP